MPIRVLVIDSQPLVQLGLLAATDHVEDIDVVGEAENGEDGVAKFKELRPDVTVVSLRLPDLCAADDLHRFFEIDPAAKILVRSEGAGDAEIRASVDGGALGFISEETSANDLVRAIKGVDKGKSYFDDRIARTMDLGYNSEKLTPAETDVLSKIVGGLSNKEIAFALDVSENTVKTHVRHIFEKLGVSDRTNATVTAIKRGLVRVDI